MRDELLHFHKLDDVSLCSPSSERQEAVIRIQFIHGRKILRSNSNNDDRKWQIRRINNGALRCLKVRYDPIGDDEEDKVVAGVCLVGTGEPGHVSYDGGEVGGAVQLDRVQGLVVGRQHAVHPRAVRVSGQVQVKLVADLAVWRSPGPEPQRREQLVAVVVLDDLPDCLDGGDVLVGRAARVDVVQGPSVLGVAITGSEVYGHCEAQLCPVGNVVKECGLQLQFTGKDMKKPGVLVFVTFLLLSLLVDEGDNVGRVWRGGLPPLHQLGHGGDQLANVGVRPARVPVVHTDLDRAVVVRVADGGHAEGEGQPVGVEVPLDDLGSVDHGVAPVLPRPTQRQEGVTFSEAEKIFRVQSPGP